jgi:AraC-like DNA-binding protein
MLAERLFENLDLRVEPFAVCCLVNGWRLNLPAPELVTLHFVLKGECALVTDDAVSLPMRMHTLAVVPQGVAHSIECGVAIEHEATPGGDDCSPCSLALFSAGEDEVDFRAACGRVRVTFGGSLGLFDLMQEPVVLDFSDNERMRNLFDELIEEEQNESPGSRAMISALMNQCLVTVFRRLDEQAKGQLPWLSALQNARLAPAIERVLASPGDPHSLESLAGISGMSRSSFAERFAASIGRTPMEFVREVRIREGGKLLLTTDLSVDGIADRVGFASRSHFSRAFRDYFSQTPTEFRST